MKDLTKLQEDIDFQDKLEEFSKASFGKETKKILKIIQNGQIPQSSDFNDKAWKKLTLLFWEKQDKRCAICEKDKSKPDGGFGDVEHYRPKSIYWWLAYNPYNYYLSCFDCNRYFKGDYFPLSDNQSNTVYSDRKNIRNEKPLLLNPILDNPKDYFQLVFIIHSSTNKGIAILQSKNGINPSLNKRADKTIEVYNLDLHSYENNYRDKARFYLLNDYYNDLFEIAKAKKLKSDREFKGTLLQKVKERPELKTLDLLKLIIEDQVIINTLTN